MKTREEEIKEAAKERVKEELYNVCLVNCDLAALKFEKRNSFYDGAKWADEHQKNPWVSVKDRLPERITSRDSNGTKIIDCCSKEVFGYDASYKIGRLVCYNHESEMWESHDAYTIGEITHWKPVITPEQVANPYNEYFGL